MQTATITSTPRAATDRRADPAAIRDAVHTVDRAVADGLLPCAVVGVADSNGILALEVIAGPNTPKLRADSVFFLASVTKPIVASAVMRLVDAGVVDLHAPIDRWVPAFRGPGKHAVTPWHVLTHTSGIPDQDIEALYRQRPSAARTLDWVCRAPLRHEPGTRYEYCSSSFYLLAAMTSAAVGRPFPDALRELVLEPAEMVDTSFDPRSDRSRIVIVEGIPLGNRLVRELALRFLAKATLPGGGLWGTAIDLLRFGQSLLPDAAASGRALLSPDALAEMTREQTEGVVEILDDGSSRDPRYALGWGKPRIDGRAPSVAGGVPTTATTVPASAGTFTHGGATGTRLWIDPDRDLVFVFLTNLWGADDAQMYAALGDVYRSMGTLTIEPHSVHEPS